MVVIKKDTEGKERNYLERCEKKKKRIGKTSEKKKRKEKKGVGETR